MDEQNRDNFYEGPPLEEPEHWHDGAIVPEAELHAGERGARDEAGERAELDKPLVQTELPDGGFYPMPSAIERPHSTEAGLPPGTLISDPSLSRAVDREAAGLDAEAAGYDRSDEGPPPGPLDPAADEVPADAGDQPGGQWGSSG